MKTNNFLEIFKRLQTVGINTQQELAKSVGITQSAVADAKRRGNFPNGWAVAIAKQHGVSLDFLLSGETSGATVKRKTISKKVTETPQTNHRKGDRDMDLKDKLLDAYEKIIERDERIAELERLLKKDPPSLRKRSNGK